MKKGFIKRSFEFILVFTVIIVAIFLLEFFKSSQIRLGLITFLTIFYPVVGIVYHYEENNLKATQILEYLAIGAMMFVILSSIYH